MFKGFIPGKRVSSVDLTARNDISGKENKLDTAVVPMKGSQKPAVFQDSDRNIDMKVLSMHTKKQGADSEEMVEAFDKLLDDLQIPDTLRPKLNGMDSTVKAAMLRSSQISPAVLATPKKAHGTLRKARSTESIASPHTSTSEALMYDFPPPPNTASRFFGAAMKSTTSLSLSSESGSHLNTSHGRGVSLDMSRNSSKMNLSSASKSEFSGAKYQKDKTWTKDSMPSKYVNALLNASSLQLDIEIIKKLRMLLRNESANWTETFLKLGGYTALLTRLNELLEVEWREEQHDDQLLHELLRCFKALSTSSVGCSALRLACPTPYAQLVKLLYSDKKPGDVATRQLVAEMILLLVELYPPSSLPSVGQPRRREIWEELSDDAPCTQFNESTKLITLPPPHRSLFSLFRSLLLTKAPPPAEAPAQSIEPHEFIESLHVPRIYKTYLQELSDACRDYFWVFCHPSNTIWNLDDTDETRVEKPRAPGGMTGGVEFEAMGYLTTHFKLLNAIAKSSADLKLPKENELSAYRFHSDMFASGIERIILVARKASTTYYPTLHLEIARYVSQAIKAQFELPWTLSRAIGAPPASMTKSGRNGKDREHSRYSASNKTPGSRGSRSTPHTPSRSKGREVIPGAPKIPTPKKVEPIRL